MLRVRGGAGRRPAVGNASATNAHASAERRGGEDYISKFDDRHELRADRLLVATGRRPRVGGLGLETVGVEPMATGSSSTRICARVGAW